MFARPFSKTELTRNCEEVVRGKVRLAVERIRSEANADGKRVVDGFKWWTFLASDVAAHVVCSESFRMLESGKVNPS